MRCAAFRDMATARKRVIWPPAGSDDGGARTAPDLEQVRKLTRVLDHYLVDPLLGLLLPGVGDLIGSMLGLYLVGLAVQRGTSPVIIARMLLNLALDAG